MSSDASYSNLPVFTVKDGDALSPCSKRSRRCYPNDESDGSAQTAGRSLVDAQRASGRHLSVESAFYRHEEQAHQGALLLLPQLSTVVLEHLAANATTPQAVLEQIALESVKYALQYVLGNFHRHEVASG